MITINCPRCGRTSQSAELCEGCGLDLAPVRALLVDHPGNSTPFPPPARQSAAVATEPPPDGDHLPAKRHGPAFSGGKRWVLAVVAILVVGLIAREVHMRQTYSKSGSGLTYGDRWDSGRYSETHAGASSRSDPFAMWVDAHGSELDRVLRDDTWLSAVDALENADEYVNAGTLDQLGAICRRAADALFLAREGAAYADPHAPQEYLDAVSIDGREFDSCAANPEDAPGGYYGIQSTSLFTLTEEISRYRDCVSGRTARTECDDLGPTNGSTG